MMRVQLAAVLLALALVGSANGAKDDAYVGYLTGADATGIVTLGSIPIVGSVRGSAFFTITDFGSNKFGWTADISESLPNGLYWGLYYSTPANRAAPPLIFNLTRDYTSSESDDVTPFGAFNGTQLNSSIIAIGGTPAPVIDLVVGGYLLAAYVSSDNKAILGFVTNNPEVGPPPPDFNETSFTASVDETTLTFPGYVGLPNATAVLSITDDLDGNYTFNLFTTLNTTQQPEALSLVFVDFDDTIKVALKLKLTAKNWLQARSDDGYIGQFLKADLFKGLWKQGVDGAITLYAKFEVSNIQDDYTNWGAFDPSFDVDATQPLPPPPPPRKRPPPVVQSPPPAPVLLKGIYSLQNVKTKEYLTYTADPSDATTARLRLIPPAKKQRGYWSLNQDSQGNSKLETVSLNNNLFLTGNSTAGSVSLATTGSIWKLAVRSGASYSIALQGAAGTGKPKIFLGTPGGGPTPRAVLYTTTSSSGLQEWALIKA